MKKFKAITRYIVPVLSYLFLTGLFFSAGYVIGTHTPDEIMTVNPQIAATASPPPKEAQQEEVKTFYHIILEQSQLRLYLNEGEKQHLISNDNISEASYPADDITRLKEGVNFDTLSDALSYLENFLS